jgi:sugar transferase (PEP-CTERM system associated)
MIRLFNQYVSPKVLLLVGLETVLISLSLLFAVRLRFWNDASEFQACTGMPHFAWQLLVVVVVFQACFYLNDLYGPSPATLADDEGLRVGQSLGAASLLLGVLYFLVPGLLVGHGVFFLNMILAGGLVFLSRVALDRVWSAAPAQNIVILGAGTLASTVAREIGARHDLKWNLLGFVQDASAPSGQTRGLANLPLVGHWTDLEALALKNRVARIIVALEDRRGILPTAALVKLRVRGVVVEDAHSAISSLTGRVWLSTVRPSWFVFSDGFYRSPLTALIKRAIDICCGVLGFSLSLPLMLLVALAVRLDSRGPVLYRQIRVGWKGDAFEILKFRSMRLDAETHKGAQWATVNDPRVTRIGKFLRKFRLDELPQFINVIRGDMSFVGPRPERPSFVAALREEIPYYDERHSVRPGLTGWAQVQYPYGASVDDAYRKLEYDLFYLKNMSLFFDCAIIFQTIRIVLAGEHGR